MARLVCLLAALCLLGAAAVVAAPARATETEIVCGDEEEPMPAVDENGIIVEPDSSTEAERAADYDDSGEDLEIPEDEGVSLTPEELAALGNCLGESASDAFADAADAFDAAWDGSTSLLLGTFGPGQLPYGGTVEFSLESGATGTTARAAKSRGRSVLGRSKLKLRSGDTKKLRFRLNDKGRKLLKRRGRVVAVGKLKLTDKLSGKSRTKKARIVLRHKR